MSDLSATPVHPSALTHLLGQRSLRASDDVTQWLRALFIEGFNKVLRAVKATSRTTLDVNTAAAATSSLALVETALTMLLPPGSAILKTVQTFTRNTTHSAIDFIVPPAKVYGALIEPDSPGSAWSDTSAASVQELAAYIAAATHTLVDLFLEAVAMAASSTNGIDGTSVREDGGEIEIKEAQVSAVLDGSSEWSTLFLSRALEQKNVILKVNIIRPGTGNILKTVKVDLSAPIAKVVDYLRGKWINAKSDDRFCLFLPTDDSDEVEGFFLDPQRTWHDYPEIHENTLVEFHDINRVLSVYIDEKRSHVFEIEETWTIEQIVKQVTFKIGIMDASRYGLLLLGAQQEVRQRREELEGVHVGTMTAGSTMGHSIAPSRELLTVSSNSSLSLSSGDLPSISNGGAVFAGTGGAQRNKSLKRPVSQMFFNSTDGVSRTRRSTTEAAPSSSPKTTSRNNTIILEEVDFVQTKDKSEWLRPQATLRGIGFEKGDSLLLIRLEKILNFDQRMHENPLKLCEDLLENTQELLHSLQTIEADFAAFLQNYTLSADELATETGPPTKINVFHPGMESWMCPCDYRGSRPGEFTLIKGDVVEIYMREGTRWQGVLRGTDGWIDPAAIAQFMTYMSVEAQLVPAYHSSSVSLVRKSTVAVKHHTTERTESGSSAGTTPVDVVSNSSTSSLTMALELVSSATYNKDRSSPVLTVPPAIRSGLGSESRISMQGYLLKKGRTFDQWKRKYYVLRSHACWYYTSERDEKLLGQFSILGADVTVVEKYKGRTFVFSVLANGILRYLSAPNQDEMNKWVAALKAEAQRD